MLTILFGEVMLRVAGAASRQEGTGRNNEKITLTTGIVSLVLFNALTGYFLYTDFRKVPDLNTAAVDLTQMVFGILGVMMLIIGNIMPKARRNSMIGLRTPWSMKNEEVWKKSQHFGGISFIVAGAVIVVISFLTKGRVCLTVSLAVILLTALIGSWYSYRTAKKSEC